MAEEISNVNENQIVSEAPLKVKPKLLGKIVPILAVVAVVGLGVFTGFYFSGKKGSTFKSGVVGEISSEDIVKGSEFGAKDTSQFKDIATGIIEVGGIDGEGTHKLIREGGVSQTVYLTSSVLDLDQFVGKKVQIWGETFKAQKAGWLMDVGKIKVLE
ncbi:hypothetical protein COT64_01670 [Candidatus Shapirobacteria bacterium CG09_land_8_20_14_0_10_39_12]|uniref:Uncharacterized protein n=1 Tax=Candidatus Shapirobacteria bacterium CG09_land_8_20_14_0_10_39_12 TaxID=1974885 RepID=A0A2H0WPP5_9BACT|nr:MAG: hypothetical protein COT64_01670 [Candidatus Shapirobacteria bacterium CG09_land_8_20_14_0_10_39_12]